MTYLVMRPHSPSQWPVLYVVQVMHSANFVHCHTKLHMTHDMLPSTACSCILLVMFSRYMTVAKCVVAIWCRLAAIRGGGSLTAPVQRVTDFLAEQVSTGPLPSSSYRFGLAAPHNRCTLLGMPRTCSIFCIRMPTGCNLPRSVVQQSVLRCLSMRDILVQAWGKEC